MSDEKKDLNEEKLETKDEQTKTLSMANESDSFNTALEDKIEKQTNDALIKDDKKKKRRIIIISVIIIIVLAAIGIFYYITNDPRFIMKTAVNKVFNNLNRPYDYEEGNIGFKLNDKASDDFVNITFDYKRDNKQGLFDANANVLFTGQAEFDIHLQQAENKLYLGIPILYENYLSYDKEAISKETTNAITDAFKNAITEIINSEKINGDNLNITINEKNVKTKRVSLKIDNNNIKNISEIIANNLKECPEFIDILMNNDDLNKQDALKEINKIVIDKIEKPITISLYTKGLTNEFVKLEIFTENNEEIINDFNLIKTDNNNYEYNIINNDGPQDSFNGNLKLTDNKVTSDFQITIDEVLTYEGKIELNSSIKEAKDYQPENISNDKNITELTDDELQNIYMGLFTTVFYTSSALESTDV